MLDHHSNDERVAIARIQQGLEDRTVIPFIGAGVSFQSASLPLWASLLQLSLAWSEELHAELGLQLPSVLSLRDRLQLNKPSLTCFSTWAQAVFCNSLASEHWLSPGYGEWLETFFGNPNVVDDQIYQSLRAMDPRVIVTTNYDRLLSEQVLPDGQVVTWGNPNTIRGLFRESSGIFHLHGTYDEPRSVILTSDDYTRIVQEEQRSAVANMLASHSILLFLGVSPEGATDRHLASLLRLAERAPADERRQPRTHVLLHRGQLPAAAVVRLKSFDIQPVSFGEEHRDLPPFLDRLTRDRVAAASAAAMIGLDRNAGEELRHSRWHPVSCLGRVESRLRFMGWRSSKWVTEASNELESLLELLDGREQAHAHFLILNPKSSAYQRLVRVRGMSPGTAHLEYLADLERRHRSLTVKCVDFLTAFRLTAVDDREVGLSLYPTTHAEHRDSDHGWASTHFSLSTEKPRTLGRSLVVQFDDHFSLATPLAEVLES